jgi:hypothetical protein
MKNIQNYIKQLDPTWASSIFCLTHESLIFIFVILTIIRQFLKRFHDKETLDQILSHPKGKNIKSFYSNGKEIKVEFKDNDKPKENSS